MLVGRQMGGLVSVLIIYTYVTLIIYKYYKFYNLFLWNIIFILYVLKKGKK